VGDLVERRLGDARLELDVAAQVEAVGDMVGVFQDLGLRRIALGPFPILLELARELVGVLHALDVAARTRIAVPVPGAADALAGFDNARGEARLAQPVEHVHASEARAHNHRIEVHRILPLETRSSTHWSQAARGRTPNMKAMANIEAQSVPVRRT